MNKKLNTALAVLGGLGAGAATMYFLDPERGTNRRALVRDKVVGLSNDTRRAVIDRAKVLKGRAEELAHNAKGLLAIGTDSEKVQAGFIPSAGNGS